MKDALQLIFWAAGCAVFAWCFWHFLGEEGFGISVILALVTVLADNIRLRRKLAAAQRR